MKYTRDNIIGIEFRGRADRKKTIYTIASIESDDSVRIEYKYGKSNMHFWSKVDTTCRNLESNSWIVHTKTDAYEIF